MAQPLDAVAGPATSSVVSGASAIGAGFGQIATGLATLADALARDVSAGLTGSLAHPWVLGLGIGIGAAAVLIAWLVVTLVLRGAAAAPSAHGPRVATTDPTVKNDLQTLALPRLPPA